MPAPTGIVDKNPANNTEGKHIRNYSTFDKSLSYRLYNTHRFGDYVPTFVMDGVPNDEISLNSFDKIDSLSLKAPFQGSLRKIKESFMVPNMAILPLQWDRIYAQNSNGDDVPIDANCVLSNFPSLFQSLWTSCLTTVNGITISTDANLASFLTGLMRVLVLGEYVYSSGSLLNVLGYKAFTQFSCLRYDSQAGNRAYSINYDEWFDAVVDSIFEHFNTIRVVEPVGGSTVIHPILGLNGNNGSTYLQGYEVFRRLFELFRENPLCYIVATGTSYDFTNISAASTFIGTLTTSGGLLNPTFTWNLPSSSYSGDDPLSGVTTDPTVLNPNVLNLSRLLSYQLVCFHFYSNSSIDFIYSADLYRQYIGQLTNGILPSGNASFTWNGMNLYYDYLAGRRLAYGLAVVSSSPTKTYLIGHIMDNVIVNGSVPSGNVLAIWAAIFGYRQSLRYGDYFTASRPRPLAPINTDVSVNSNAVSVIDITRNIQAQRFANSVMRSRSKIEEYVKSLFGKAPQPDYHNPFFLTRQEEYIFGDQVQNTTYNTTPGYQQSRSANWTGNLSRHTFTFHNDDMHPCIYLQIVSYDSPRAYSRSVERQFLIADRFDMFNPDFQYIGDQPIYGIELGYPTQSGLPNIFAYTSRDMEYKQRFDQCCSGFSSGSLPGWAFTDSQLPDIFSNQGFINPDFIRSRNSDIDNLYLSLSSWSLGKYFHFTCITDNNVSAKRAMAVDPQILA